jgi:hypothetical protein
MHKEKRVKIKRLPIKPPVSNSQITVGVVVYVRLLRLLSAIRCNDHFGLLSKSICKLK